MNIFFYAIIFIIGTVFGSFYTLAVYRIPKNIDIVKKHSYCPNCNNKLGFFELIPVLSYILLGGKCKHCKQKIRIRYLFLEILAGTSFVVLALALKVDVYNLSISNLIIYAFVVLYLTAIIIISGIDKEYRKIDKRVLAYGIIISILYMIYLYTIDGTSIYRYAIYLAIYVILLSIETLLLRRYAKDSYIINILLVLTMILTFTDLRILTYTATMALIASGLYALLIKYQQNKTTNKKVKISQIPVGFFIGASNIIVLFIVRVFENYMI